MTLTATQAEFAELQGWNRSTVTRLKQAGRLVLLADGRVDVVASRQRIEATGGVRDDVKRRHAAARGEGGPRRAAKAPPEAGGETRADAQARKLSAEADMAIMEAEKMRGSLIPKDDVDLALKSVGAALRARLDVLPDKLAPLVAPITDLPEVHAVLSEHCRALLAAVADELQQQERAAT